jgi:hypothetical protein
MGVGMATFKDYFNSKIPQAALQDVVQHVFEGYRNTSKFMKAQELQPGPTKNVYPYNRCANIDSNLLALNNKYEGLKALSEINHAGNWFYTLISYENIRMTMSAVESPTTVPRESGFRNDLANCQFKFNYDEYTGNIEVSELKGDADTIIYALIIHGPAIDNPQYPAFIDIVFPNKKCTEYLDRINLFNQFPDLIESLKREGTEIIPDKAEVKLSVQEKML